MLRTFLSFVGLFIVIESAHGLGVTIGVVSFVHDGDTVSVRVDGGDEMRVRMAGIDAPERDQIGGREASLILKDLVNGERVAVLPVERDRWGRVVAKVFRLKDGQDVGLAMIILGWAWAYRTADEQYRAAEAEARRLKHGIWIEEQVIPPWEHRRQRSRK